MNKSEIAQALDDQRQALEQLRLVVAARAPELVSEVDRAISLNQDLESALYARALHA